MNVRTWPGKTWRRIRSADIVDWMFGALFLVVGGALATIVAVAVIEPEAPEPWSAISFQAPVEIKTRSDLRPLVDERPDLPAPAISTAEDGVPLRITRFVDCAVFVCPKGGIPITADVRWVEVNTDGALGMTFPIAEDFDTTYVENQDYVVGQLISFVLIPPPLQVPDEVLEYIEEEGRVVSAWRIEGESIAKIADAQAAGWASEVFHLYHPAAGGYEE